MKFASISLLALTTSFVSAGAALTNNSPMQITNNNEEFGEQQQQQKRQRRVTGARTTPRKGRRNTKDTIASSTGNNQYYKDKVANEENNADVGILSPISHIRNKSEQHFYQHNHQHSKVGDDHQYITSNGDRELTLLSVGAGSCGASYINPCADAGTTGDVIIGSMSCNAREACAFVSEIKDYAVTIGDESCNNEYACEYLGKYCGVTIGNGSCNGRFSCIHYFAPFDADAVNTIQIGDNSCNCNYCCENLYPGSVVGDCRCNSPSDGCSDTLVNEPTPGDCNPPVPSEMPSSAPSEMPTDAPTSSPTAADCGDYVCDSNPNLVVVCVVPGEKAQRLGGKQPSTECIPKNAVQAILGRNDESTCGPCAA